MNGTWIPCVSSTHISYMSILSHFTVWNSLDPRPLQLSITCNTKNWGEPGIFSQVSVTYIIRNGENLPNKQALFCVFSTDYTFNSRSV